MKLSFPFGRAGLGAAVLALGSPWGCAVYEVPVDPAGGAGGEAATGTGTGGNAGKGGSGTVDATNGDSIAPDSPYREASSLGDIRGSEPRDETSRGPETGPDSTRPAEPDEDASLDAAPPADARVDAANDVTGECVRETRSAFCLRVGKNCGTVSARDNCGILTSQDCGLCVPLEACGGGGTANICGIPPNLARGGTVTASNVGLPPEEMAQAFDNDGLTKWFVGANKTPWIAYQFAANATHVVTSYAIASPNDFPERDPTGWQLQGSNDGTTWTTLDTRTAQTFPNRFLTVVYPCTNQTAYSRYRLQVTTNNGSPDTQLAEILLFGN